MMVNRELLFNGNWFANNPDKVLAETSIGTTAYGGEVTVYKGTIDNLDAIDVHNEFMNNQSNPTVSAKTIVTEKQVDDRPELLEVEESILERSKKKYSEKLINAKKDKDDSFSENPDLPDMYSFDEIYDMYNKDISLDELRCFVWHKQRIGFPLSQQWYDKAGLADKSDQISEEEKLRWMENGVAMYHEGALVPAYEYLSGNIYQKYYRVADIEGSENTGQDRERILSKYGQKSLNTQLAAILQRYNDVNESKLVIKPADSDNGLKLTPVNKFSRTFTITNIVGEEEFRLRAGTSIQVGHGKPDFLNDKKLNEETYGDLKRSVFDKMTLADAFQYWLVRYDDIPYKANTSYQEIIEIYINQKQKPSRPEYILNSDWSYMGKDERNSEKSKWDAIWEKKQAVAKREGERLFLEFLHLMIEPTDKSKIEFEWNEKFNNFVPVDYNKVPVAFPLAKMFGGRQMDIRPEKREAAAFLFNEGSGCLAYGVGLGKGHLLTSDILTPTGYRKMGSLKVGDPVIGKNGTATKIEGVYPLGYVQCYRVRFSDGSYTDVSDEHLWDVQTINYRNNYPDKWKTVQTKDIKDSLYNYRGNCKYSIPMVSPVEFEEKELPIHPYLLGCLLGDGGLSSGSIQFSNSESDILQRVSDEIPKSTHLVPINEGEELNWRISRVAKSGENELVRALKLLGLMGTKSNGKFIPDIYKINSAKNRLELLKGLLDTDGYVQNKSNGKKGCTLQYTTVSNDLCEGVEFLVNSFGGTFTKTSKIPTFTYKGERKSGQLAYTLTIRMPKGIIPVSSEKHLSKFEPKTKYQPIRFITAIEDIGNQEAQCIRVAAEDHLYVCENFIVTHNTISSIMAIRQNMEAGYCKRPMIVVPLQTYKQWISEIKGIMPDITINTLFNLRKDYLEQVMDVDGNVEAVKENSITVITYNGFDMLGFNESTFHDLKMELYDILNQGGVEGDMTEKKRAGLMEKLESLVGMGLKGGFVNIEDLGIDYMCFDEAHNFKKIFTSVKGEYDSETDKREKNQYKINSGKPSSIGRKAFMLSHYVMKNNNYRNIVLLTATPFTNSPLEIFSMLSLVAYEKLKQTDLNNINSFFDNFINTSREMVVNAKLNPEYREVIKGFNNLPALQSIIYRYFNRKPRTAEEDERFNSGRPSKFVLPQKKRVTLDNKVASVPSNEKIETYIELNAIQQEMMANVIDYAEGYMTLSELAGASSYMSEVDDDDVLMEAQEGAVELSDEVLDDDEMIGVRILRAMNFSRNIALSPYLYKFSGLPKPTYKEYVESSPKLMYAIDCIKAQRGYQLANGLPISGAVLYMDRGTAYFGHIAEYLVKEIGYSQNEVGMIYGGMSSEKRVEAQNRFLGIKWNQQKLANDILPDDERMKVIIGSSTIKEGVNLQKESNLLINCFVDWNPTDMIQLEGRIWRQGNQYKNVAIVTPLMIDSADIFLYQKLEEKSARINSIWNNNGTSTMSVDEMDVKETKYALIKDPRKIAEFQILEEVEKVQDDYRAKESLVGRLENIVSYQSFIDEYKPRLVESLKGYRDVPVNVDGKRLIGIIDQLVKNQTDVDGRPIYSKYGVHSKMTWAEQEEANANRVISEYHKPYGYYDEFKSNVKVLNREISEFLFPQGKNMTDVSDMLDQARRELEELNLFKENLQKEDFKLARIEEVVRERTAAKIKSLDMGQLVDKFATLLPELNKRETKHIPKQKALDDYNCQVMDADGNRVITKSAIASLEKCLKAMPQTKELNTIDGTRDSEYTEERVKIHDAIVDQFKANTACIKQDKPIAILTGGSPASGKSTFLTRFAPYTQSDKIFRIDADEVRSKLPEYLGWNANSTHLETKDIVDRLLEGEWHKPCKYDLIYDGTMNKAKNYKPLIGKLKRLGYEVYIVYMGGVTKKEIVNRALNRYQKSGRYVPMEVIDDFFSKGTEALEELKGIVDGWIELDASTLEYNMIGKGGKEIPKDRPYSAIGNGGVPDEIIVPTLEIIEKRLKLLKLRLSKDKGNAVVAIRIKLLTKKLK